MTIASDFPHVAVSEQKGEPVKGGYGHFRIVPARYPLRTVGTVFSVLIIAAVLHSVFVNPRWGWAVFAAWFFAAPLLVGLGRTFLFTAPGALVVGTTFAEPATLVGFGPGR